MVILHWFDNLLLDCTQRSCGERNINGFQPLFPFQSLSRLNLTRLLRSMPSVYPGKDYTTNQHKTIALNLLLKKVKFQSSPKILLKSSDDALPCTKEVGLNSIRFSSVFSFKLLLSLPFAIIGD
jgi:hypothetical protein